MAPKRKEKKNTRPFSERQTESQSDSTSTQNDPVPVPAPDEPGYEFLQDNDYLDKISKKLKNEPDGVFELDPAELGEEPTSPALDASLAMKTDFFEDEDEECEEIDNISRKRTYYGSESDTEMVNPTLTTKISGDHFLIVMTTDSINYNPWCPQIEATLNHLLSTLNLEYRVEKQGKDSSVFKIDLSKGSHVPLLAKKVSIADSHLDQQPDIDQQSTASDGVNVGATTSTVPELPLTGLVPLPTLNKVVPKIQKDFKKTIKGFTKIKSKDDNKKDKPVTDLQKKQQETIDRITNIFKSGVIVTYNNKAHFFNYRNVAMARKTILALLDEDGEGDDVKIVKKLIQKSIVWISVDRPDINHCEITFE